MTHPPVSDSEFSKSPEADRAAGWENNWATRNTPWDAGMSAPALLDLCAELSTSPTALLGVDELPGLRALVTGCGSGYDVFSLADAGFDATGVDIAPSARPRFEEIRAAQLPEIQERTRLLTLDFFAPLPQDLVGSFQFIWDYTFYCAIAPELREQWQVQVARLLGSRGVLAMLIFPVVPGADETVGPPFPLDPDAICSALEPNFERLLLKRVEKSHPGRDGREYLGIFRRRD